MRCPRRASSPRSWSRVRLTRIRAASSSERRRLAISPNGRRSTNRSSTAVRSASLRRSSASSSTERRGSVHFGAASDSCRTWSGPPVRRRFAPPLVAHHVAASWRVAACQPAGEHRSGTKPAGLLARAPAKDLLRHILGEMRVATDAPQRRGNTRRRDAAAPIPRSVFARVAAYAEQFGVIGLVYPMATRHRQKPEQRIGPPP